MSGIARMRRHAGAASSNRRKTDRRPAEGTERDLAELVGILGLFTRSRGAVLDAAAGAAAAALRSGGKILIFGNGGSAAEAQHFAAELVNGLARRNGRPLPAIALSTDTSCLTAVGNDRGFDRTFSRQVEALGRAGDVAVALTTSGRSPNVVRALRSARTKGLITIGLTGRGGGPVAPLADYLLDVTSGSTARIQEAHLFILHLLAGRLEEAQASGG